MQVEVAKLRFTIQALSLAHLFPAHEDLELSTGPIIVSPLDDGSLFVHNGRHRTLRARLAGVTHLEAEWLPVTDTAPAPTAPAPAVLTGMYEGLWHHWACPVEDCGCIQESEEDPRIDTVQCEECGWSGLVTEGDPLP